jgi:hypothetical protein
MIQVYQLRKFPPNPITTPTIKEQISTCMQALEQVSKTWLVATMVHKLFENILGWCEIPDALPQPSVAPLEASGIPRSTSVRDFGAQTPAESALLSSTHKMELPHRTKPLTPGLKDYLDAALLPIKVYMSEPPPQREKEDWDEAEMRKREVEGVLQFLPEDEELEWDEDDEPRTPASTGLNPAMW